MASVHAAPIRPQSRPRELEDPLNHYVYHPLAARLARLLLPTGISPNAVSVGSLIALVAAAFAYTGLAWPIGVLAGFSLMLLWHVIDGADGDLARMKGVASATGELIDGVCDYAGNVILYFAFAFMLDDTLGGWAFVLAGIAGASHVVQTNHAESQRRNYLWWAYGVPWMKHAHGTDDAVFARRGWFNRSFGFWASGYLKLARAMSPGTAQIDAALAGTQGNPRRTRRVRALARRNGRCAVRYQQALGANPKTLIIAASMALGSPVWFFLAEIFLLNLVLILSVRHHNRANRRLADALTR
jgi:phosphatidylglycerophosphate synthase